MTKQDRMGKKRSALLCLALLCAAGPALAHEAPPAPPAASGSKSARPADPISLIEGDAESWSVSNTDAGCYLMSPRRKSSSRLAIGRHPVLGGGVFAVGLALSMAGPDAKEPIGIETTPVGLIKPGQMTAAGLLFVALDTAEMSSVVKELRENGVLWIRVRNTGVAHSGKGLDKALSDYTTACAGTNLPVATATSHE